MLIAPWATKCKFNHICSLSNAHICHLSNVDRERLFREVAHLFTSSVNLLKLSWRGRSLSISPRYCYCNLCRLCVPCADWIMFVQGLSIRLRINLKRKCSRRIGCSEQKATRKNCHDERASWPFGCSLSPRSYAKIERGKQYKSHPIHAALRHMDGMVEMKRWFVWYE